MATFCVEIADESVGRVITAMCANYNYQAMLSNPNWNPAEPTDPVTNPEQIPNPETPDQFANRMTRGYLMNNTHAYEVQQAKAEAGKDVPPPPPVIDPDNPV